MKPFELTFLHKAILISLIFLGITVSPFLTTLLLAAILVTGAYPLHNWLLKKLNGRARIAAVLMSLFIGIIFSMVFTVLILLISQEAVSTYQNFETWIRDEKFNIDELLAGVSKFFGILPGDLTAPIIQAGQTFSTKLFENTKYFVSQIVWLVVNFFLLVFSMYFFFKDGPGIIRYIERIIPLPHPYGEQIFSKFRHVSLAMLYGIFLAAAVQGILGGIGLAVAGIRNPVFWGTAMGFFGMLPLAGTGIVWVPAGLYLLFSGHVFAGVGLLLWGGLIVALIDNLIKPLIIAKQAQTYPFATFLVVIGGLMVFGLKGAIIAPMVLAGTVSLLHIYDSEKA